MITLTAKIDILSGNGSFIYADSNIQGNNISSDLSALLDVKRRVENPFIIGASKLGSGATFSGQVNYFIGSELSNESGEFTSQYEIVIENYGTTFTIAFDDINNRYPTSIIVDGQTFVNDDPWFTVVVPEAHPHTIIIDNWNTPNSPLIITGIYRAISINIDKTNLISIEREIKDRADFSLPSFGVISNNGKVSFVDTTGEIKDYAEMKLLKSGLPISIYLNNTLKNKTQVIGFYRTTEWNYDEYNKQVSVSFDDGLTILQDITIPAINFIPSSHPEISGEQVYKAFYAIAEGYGYILPHFDNLDYETRGLLRKLYFPFKIRESCGFWTALQKFCEATQCHIYRENGETVFKYKGGN